MGDSADWDTFVLANKASIWGPPKPVQPDAFYTAKFSGGEVIPGWNADKWITDITGGLKFGTADCRTATSPRRA